jgi:hypothetical protein
VTANTKRYVNKLEKRSMVLPKENSSKKKKLDTFGYEIYV